MLIKIRTILTAAPLALLWTLAASAATPPKKVLFPEDLGPDTIDVSNYPPEHQETYKKIFIPVFGFLGGTARIVNSPLLELDAQLENMERRDHPELFADKSVAQPSSDGWKTYVQEVHERPPCCGSCPVLTLKDARALWRFLVYDSITRKTGANAASWIRQRKELVERFRKEYPKRYGELYPQASS